MAALATLRDEVLPQTVGQVDDVEYAVAGATAADKDWSDGMKKSVPLVFGFVLLFAFVLMLISFRSIVVALKAIVLNLLSVAAAYGLLVAVFQWGWGENLLDFESNGGITPWLPMFLFVILFGLSMDYHVFIISRIREAYDRGLSNEEAVRYGIKSTAGVVTSAAVVMVATFSVFALLPLIDMKEMGIGLAAAVLIDATIVRAVLLPATMKLLGERNWYLPSWLGWLPRLEHDRSVEPVNAKPASSARSVGPTTLPAGGAASHAAPPALPEGARREQHPGNGPSRSPPSQSSPCTSSTTTSSSRTRARAPATTWRAASCRSPSSSLRASSTVGFAPGARRDCAPRRVLRRPRLDGGDPHTHEVGPSGDDYTGLLSAVAGLALIGLGAVTLWRSRKTHDRLWWRYPRRLLLVGGAGLVTIVFLIPIAVSYVVTHAARGHVPTADLGLPTRRSSSRRATDSTLKGGTSARGTAPP